MVDGGVTTNRKQILVCLDGSSAGEAGLEYALAISHATGASLLLFNVIDTGVPAQGHPRPVDALGLEVARADARRYLQGIASRISKETPEGASVTLEIAEGRPAEQILVAADSRAIDLVVLTGHGTRDGGCYRLGSTAHKVAVYARQSLLLVRSQDDVDAAQRRSIERVLVLLDGSAAAESSLPNALELARTMDAEIILAHAVVRTELCTCEPLVRRDKDLLEQLSDRSSELARAYLRKVENSLEEQGARCRVIVKECDSIRQGILSLAEEESVDLIILTSHGHTSSQRVVHGSVTQQLLIHTERPVWVVQNLSVETQTQHRDAIHPRVESTGLPWLELPGVPLASL